MKAELDSRRHGDGSADWLARRGNPELGEAIAGHPVTCLADAAWFEEWFRTASPEALIVSYADKRAGQRLETMDERFASWERRYPPEERATKARGNWSRQTIAEVRERTRQIEDRVCEMASIRPDDVRRLRWTAREIERLRREKARSGGPDR